MGLLLRAILHILAYALSLYVLDTYHVLGGIHFDFVVSTRQDIAKVYVLLGSIFWICFALIKKIVSIFAFPLQILTFGLIGFVINIGIFYLCQILINTYLTGVQMYITSFAGLMIISFILSMVVSVVYWILRQII